MATEEQLKAILDQNAQFLTAMAKHQETAMQTLIETVMKAQLRDRESKTRGLDERKFKEVGVFGGSEEARGGEVARGEPEDGRRSALETITWRR